MLYEGGCLRIFLEELVSVVVAVFRPEILILTVRGVSGEHCHDREQRACPIDLQNFYDVPTRADEERFEF